MKKGRLSPYQYVALGLILIVHLSGVFLLLPPIGQLLDNYPIINCDYLFHFYQASSARNFLKVSGRFWGYDPHLMAGYPANTTYDVGYKLCELFVALFSFIGIERAYSLFIFITFVIPPLLIFGASRRFGLSGPQSLTAAFLSVIFWHLDQNITGITIPLEGLLGWGMFTFSFACFLSIFVTAVFYRYSREGDRADLVLLFVFGPLLPLVHFFSLLIISLPVAIIFLSYFRLRPGKYPLAVLLWILWILACNLFWIVPFLTFRHDLCLCEIGRVRFDMIKTLFIFRGGL